MADFYKVPEEDRNWGLLLNPWRPGGGMEPRKRGPPPAARKPAPRQKHVPASQVPQAPVEPEMVRDEGASPLKARLRRPHGDVSPNTGAGSTEAQEAEIVPPEGGTPTEGTPNVRKEARRKKVPAVSFS